MHKLIGHEGVSAANLLCFGFRMLPRRAERELRIHEPAYLTKQHMDLDPSVWGLY